jgi:hypothetical protein
MITVKDLKEMLEQHEDTDIVIVASGVNTFSPLSKLEKYTHTPWLTWDEELRELTLEDLEAGFTDEDVYSGWGGREALVLWPIHREQLYIKYDSNPVPD